MPPFISGLINGRNQISRSVTWGTSDLRKWLNGVFFRGTFSKNEQRLMRVSRILNDNSTFFGLAKPEYTGPGLRDWTAAVRFMRQRRRHRHSGRKSGQAGFYGAARYPDSIPEKVRNRAGQVTAPAAIYSQRRIHDTYLLTERLWQGR